MAVTQRGQSCAAELCFSQLDKRASGYELVVTHWAACYTPVFCCEHVPTGQLCITVVSFVTVGRQISSQTWWTIIRILVSNRPAWHAIWVFFEAVLHQLTANLLSPFPKLGKSFTSSVLLFYISTYS